MSEKIKVLLSEEEVDSRIKQIAAKHGVEIVWDTLADWE